MYSTSLTLVFGMALMLTGCGLRATVESDHVSSTANEMMRDGVVQRHSSFQKTQTTVEVDLDPQNSQEHAARMQDQTAVRRAVQPTGPVPTIQIEIGAVNIHFGDVNVTHVHNDDTQEKLIVQQVPMPVEEVTAPRQIPMEQKSRGNKQCDRLRKQHEDRLIQWDKLFR